ncbi:HCP-like protein, partial [Backusella circina FSU 941]
KKNYTKAKKWYSVASKKGDPRAKYHLGIMYEYGKGFETFLNRAISYYRLGTFYEDGRAQSGLGLLYEYGDAVEKNYQMAIEYDKDLASSNFSIGVHHLALMYYHGKGVSVD